LLHVVPELGAELRGDLDCLATLEARPIPSKVPGREGDAQRGRITLRGLSVAERRGWRPVGVARPGAMSEIEQQRTVAYRARHAMRLDEAQRRFAIAAGIASAAGFEPEQAARRGGDANGARAIVRV